MTVVTVAFADEWNREEAKEEAKKKTVDIYSDNDAYDMCCM